MLDKCWTAQRTSKIAMSAFCCISAGVPSGFASTSMRRTSLLIIKHLLPKPFMTKVSTPASHIAWFTSAPTTQSAPALDLQQTACCSPCSCFHLKTSGVPADSASTAQQSTTQHRATQPSPAQLSPAQHSAARHNTAQHGTAQRRPAQRSTTHGCTAQHTLQSQDWQRYHKLLAGQISRMPKCRMLGVNH